MKIGDYVKHCSGHYGIITTTFQNKKYFMNILWDNKTQGDRVTSDPDVKIVNDPKELHEARLAFNENKYVESW